MLQDYKLGVRMLLKYPGLTIAGGLALAIAIGIGAGWYDLAGKLLWPTIPLPDGDCIVSIETQNSLTTHRRYTPDTICPVAAPPTRKACQEDLATQHNAGNGTPVAYRPRKRQNRLQG